MDTRIFIFGLFVIVLANMDSFVTCVMMKFTNAVCQSHNESLIKIKECRIRAVSRYKNIFNFYEIMLQPIYKMSVRVQVLKKANGYKPWLYDVSLDACEFLRKPSNPFIILLVKQFKNFTNIFDQKCPVTGSKRIDGLYLDFKTLKLPIPTGEYMLQSSWLYNGKYTGFVNVSFQFIEDLI